MPQTILITGATRGIGAALAEQAAARGDRVIGTCRSTPPATPAGIDWRVADMADPATIAAMATGLQGQPIDLLICNAGVYRDKGHRIDTGFDAATWADSFAVNVTGVFLTVQALLPNLQAARGRVAIISSQMASDARAPGGSYAYRASKAAALNLGRNLAVDLAPEGVAVGIYHPGWVRTEMGGAEADIGTDEAAAGLLARFAALGPETTGCFEDWAGRALPF